ncbi:protein SAWADEE HOMEODOMAIN HOMOLOG 1-like isoform X1 [Bidens hawaiensis]|uniref:protein SAWADEE HOMEODOMAIN HOMOLOG 1-like isoform X1 n=1 Tax=Bidens hawaiensis TaxID=980011 RepID=UPI004049FC64
MAVLDDIEVDYDLEYLTNKDAAWFTCAVVLEDQNHLRVKFEGFAHSFHDEVFSVTDFSTHRDIEQLIHKFRPVSKPVEDNECSRLTEGMLVCAIYRRHDEVLYYDAIVDAVLYVEHTPEKCVCSYLLCWQHGPGEGTLTKASIEDICFIVDGDIHPKIAEFANLVKQQLKVPSVESQASSSVNVIMMRFY